MSNIDQSPGAGLDPYAHFSERPNPQDQCPHCRAFTTTRDDDELRRVCRVCGGPRIFSKATSSAREDGSSALPALRDAEKNRRERAKGRAASVVGGLALGAGVLLGLLISIVSLKGALFTLLLLSAPALALLFFGRTKAQAATKNLHRAVEDAWAKAVHDLVARGVAKNASDLAKLLEIDAARAEELLTTASVDAEVAAAALGRVRFGETGAGPTIAADPRFTALEQKLRDSAESEAEAQAEVDVESTEASRQHRADK